MCALTFTVKRSKIHHKRTHLCFQVRQDLQQWLCMSVCKYETSQTQIHLNTNLDFFKTFTSVTALTSYSEFDDVVISLPANDCCNKVRYIPAKPQILDRDLNNFAHILQDMEVITKTHCIVNLTGGKRLLCDYIALGRRTTTGNVIQKQRNLTLL